MTLILSIETATSVCSVALHENGQLLSLKEIDSDKSHSERLLQFIEEVLTESGKTKNELKAIAISEGPGSYTGLRIGLSSAKGLCFALDIPLIAINTLDALALRKSIKLQENELACPMIDARRMEVYTALYNSENERVIELDNKIIDESSFEEQLKNHRIYFFGNGAPKCSEVISSENAIFTDEFQPSSSTIGELAFEKYKAEQFEDVAYFEPNYLKEFYSPAPKKNQLLQNLVTGS